MTKTKLMTPDKKPKTLSRLKIEFTPEEAKKALVALIDEKINQYKINYWRVWERNHSACRKATDMKIKMLQEKKEQLLALDDRQQELILKLEGEIRMETVV